MLAKPRKVLGFQQQAQNLDRTEGGGKDMMGLGLLGKDPQPPLASAVDSVAARSPLNAAIRAAEVLRSYKGQSPDVFDPDEQRLSHTPGFRLDLRFDRH